MSCCCGFLFIFTFAIGIAIILGGVYDARTMKVNYSDPICKQVSWNETLLYLQSINYNPPISQPENSQVHIPLPPLAQLCRIDVQFTEVWKPPIYVYYNLDPIFQSHRRYMNAFSQSQLNGDVLSGSAAESACGDFASRQLGNYSHIAVHPCGLKSYSLFNDSYVFVESLSGRVICNSSYPESSFCSKDNIHYSSLKKRFVEPDPEDNPNGNFTFHPNEPTHPIPSTSDPDYMEWMRTYPYPNILKLHRVINVELFGDYSIYMYSVYPMKEIGGSKKLLFRRLSWVGSEHVVLGSMYLAVAGISIALSCVCSLINICHSCCSCLGCGTKRGSLGKLFSRKRDMEDDEDGIPWFAEDPSESTRVENFSETPRGDVENENEQVV